MTHTFEYLATVATITQLREATKHLPGDTPVNPANIVLIDGVLTLAPTEYTPAEQHCPGCYGPCGVCTDDHDHEPDHTKAIIL